MKLVGINGKPYVDLSHAIDTSAFSAIDREVTLGLAKVETSYTGGSLKWMGVVAPWQMRDGYVDLMHAIQAMSLEDWQDLVALADDPSLFDPTRFREYTFGDETDHPLNHAQQRLLAIRHGAYFPWKGCYHLLENDRWEDKHSGEGKDYSEEAREIFPRTIAFIESLPFTEIGRAVVFGIEGNDHAPYHRDSEPGRAEGIAQSISFDPRGTKRFALRAGPEGEPLIVSSKIYWFNDMDWHGVEPDPYFRYSIRVDGRFEPEFLRSILRR